MARHPTARKVHREAPSSDDKFIEGVLEISVWAKQHNRALTIGGILAVLLIAGTLYYRNYTGRLRTAAAVQLATVRQTVQSGNFDLAIRDLEAFIARFGGTPAGGEARLLLAESRLQAGQADQAIADVQPLASDLSSPLGAQAAFLLAAAYEVAQRPTDAEPVYLRIADAAPHDYQKQRALDALGRLRLQQDDAAGAVEAYDRLITITPEDDPSRPVYMMRRAEAQARAAGNT